MTFIFGYWPITPILGSQSWQEAMPANITTVKFATLHLYQMQIKPACSIQITNERTCPSNVSHSPSFNENYLSKYWYTLNFAVHDCSIFIVWPKLFSLKVMTSTDDFSDGRDNLCATYLICSFLTNI